MFANTGGRRNIKTSIRRASRLRPSQGFPTLHRPSSPCLRHRGFFVTFARLRQARIDEDNNDVRFQFTVEAKNDFPCRYVLMTIHALHKRPSEIE